jgi:hypothetical protein
VGWREVGVDDREQLDGGLFGGIGVSVHHALNHLDQLLLHVLDVHYSKHILDAFDCLVAHSGLLNLA